VSRVDEADALLEDVIRVSGQGMADLAPESAREFFEQFLPMPRHVRALDPQVRLIVGDKGAGKTLLFQALKFSEGRELLTRIAAREGQVTVPLSQLEWHVGFETKGTAFPAPGAFDRLKGQSSDEYRTLWLALLVRVLAESLRAHLDDAAKAYVAGSGEAITHFRLADLVTETHKAEGHLFAALDALEADLAKRNKSVVVVYDELDRVSPGDWNIVRATLQGLIQFWAVYSRRWQRIRCKIFLRRDLYERAAIRGPDVAKIAWNPAELVWRPADLYRLLFKRLANAGDTMRKYLGSAKLKLEHDELLQWSPIGKDEDDFAAPVKIVFSEYMGRDPSKGVTLKWIPNHLKDGHGRVFPRPLLRLMHEAAEIEKRDRQADRPHLIHHTAIRGGLDEVSRFRVKELTDEEFPWMRRIQRSFESHPFRVPADKRNVLKALVIDWSNDVERPPETEADRLLDYLIELGIASLRPDGKVDVGDLYLKGLHLKRRGGVARPRV
jgi:hypothetical protein